MPTGHTFAKLRMHTRFAIHIGSSSRSLLWRRSHCMLSLSRQRQGRIGCGRTRRRHDSCKSCGSSGIHLSLSDSVVASTFRAGGLMRPHHFHKHEMLDSCIVAVARHRNQRTISFSLQSRALANI